MEMAIHHFYPSPAPPLTGVLQQHVITPDVLEKLGSAAAASPEAERLALLLRR